MKHGLPSQREFRGKETVPGVADELQTPPHRHGLKLCGTPFVYRQIREIAYLQ